MLSRNQSCIINGETTTEYFKLEKVQDKVT